MKKVLAIVLAGLLLLGMMACGKDVEDPVGTETGTETSAPVTPTPTPTPDPEPDPEPDDNKEEEKNPNEGDLKSTTLALNKNTQGVKLLGVRGILSETQINCDWAGSGIEFALQNLSPSVMIETATSAPCRFKVYVNGNLHKTPLGQEYYEINKNGTITLDKLPIGSISIRVVKITDQALATAQFTKLVFMGTMSEANAPQPKDCYIEFLGGTEIAGTLSAGGTHADQDVTQAYSYLLAKEMNADYSMTTLGTGTALTKVTDVADFYSKASPVRDADATYDFARKADVVVVDLGSADVALSANDSTVTPAVFAEKYEALLTAIRQKNGEDCKIVCVFSDAMGEFGTAIKTVCRQEMGGQQEGIYLCRRTVGANGIMNAVDGIAFSNALKDIVDLAIEGHITESDLATGENGEGLKVSFKDDFAPISK